MKTLVATLAVLGFSGCVPLAPVQLRSAPEPSEQEMAQLRNIQSRTIAIRRDAVFPKVLEVLMDGGYVIRSANTDLGLVTFYQQRSEEHTSELQSLAYLVCRLLLEKKKTKEHCR